LSDLIKEKSWSVKLIKGYILGNEVKTNYCGDCKSTSQPVTGNYSNPNIVLFGCNDRKCKHTLIRMNVNSEITERPRVERISNIALENPPQAQTWERSRKPQLLM
jgi:hypothetical protein